MRILATGIVPAPQRIMHKRNSTHGGFTLLEILVVLVIISLLSGFAVLSLHPPTAHSRLQALLEHLQPMMTLAQTEAILRAEVYALEMTAIDYAFYRRTHQQWQLLDTPPYQRELLPEGILLGLEGEQSSELPAFPTPTLAPISNIPNISNPNKIQPQIIFYPSGEVTPFRLSLQLDDDAKTLVYALTGDFMGQFSLKTFQEDFLGY